MYSNFIRDYCTFEQNYYWRNYVLHLTLNYINKIHFNRGQGRLPCILSLLDNEGCYMIHSK